MSGRWTLGIDVGTTSVKALVLDRAGRVVESTAAHHGISDHADRVEVDAERWWDSLCTAVQSLTVPLSEIDAIGFSGNMSSVVLVDEALRPLRPAILLADTRGADQLATLPDEVTAGIVDATGNVPETVFSLSPLLWLRDHEPEALTRCTAWLSSKDFLRARLTGVIATEPTDAGNSLLLSDGAWADETIAALRLPRTAFPTLLTSDGSGGAVSEDAGRLSGLSAGTPVAVGAGDVAAALVGSGGLAPDQLAVSLGTSATLMAALADQHLSPQALNKLTVHPGADGGLFALGSLLTGGLALNWLRDSFGASALTAAESEPPLGELYFLPYLAGSGSPDFVPEMRGTVYGITPATRPEQLVTALMEAVSFDIAELIDAIGGDYRRIVLSGGGSRLPAWPQVLADVTGIPVTRFDAPDLSAIGAAVLAWRLLGVKVEAAGEHADVLPRPEYAPRWSRRRATYRLARAHALDHYTSTVLATRPAPAGSTASSPTTVSTDRKQHP
ncbi:FGGY family carbohydrate kinase [Microbacterium sp. 1P10UB]|uniref:xylulokinase n=1 Tax=unclassified Microbacterium TaxID=2609290 RepID=UPI00399F7CC5